MSRRESRPRPVVLSLAQQKKTSPPNVGVSLIDMSLKELQKYFTSKGKK